MTEGRLQPGTMLGRHEIKEFLGAGSQADVYRAYQQTLNCERALKVLHVHWAADSNFLRRFKAEAQRMAALVHPNIVPIHDCGEDSGRTWISMQLIPGGSLDAFLAQRGHLTIEDTLDLMWQVASALDFAHSNGVIHRDVKPGNVLVDNQKRCYLTDFGIAKALEGDLELTQENARVGTVYYMGPERFESRELDGRSDLYSLAVMVFQLVTGKLPFSGKNTEAVMLKHLQSPPDWPEESAESLGAAVVAAIELGLKKNPADRPATCDAYIRAIDSALNQEVVPVAPSPQPKPETRPLEWAGARFYASAVAAGMFGGGSWTFLSPASASASVTPVVQDGAGVVQDPDGAGPPSDGKRSERPRPVGPAPTWPDADAVTPSWSGPTRVAILLDGSAEQWHSHDASKVLMDVVSGPLRKSLEQAGWTSIRPRVDLPEGPFLADSSWFEALAGVPADVVVLLGMSEVEQQTDPGSGLRVDKYGASVTLTAHTIDVAAGVLAAEPRASIGTTDKPEARFKDAFAAAVGRQRESLVEGLLTDVDVWRENARDRGQVIEVIAVGREVELGLGTWLGDALRSAPGGVATGFEVVGQWGYDPREPALELAPGIEVRMREGQAWARWRLSYRGQLVDLRRYVDEGLTRYLAWVDVQGTPRVRTQGSMLVYELP